MSDCSFPETFDCTGATPVQERLNFVAAARVYHKSPIDSSLFLHSFNLMYPEQRMPPSDTQRISTGRPAPSTNPPLLHSLWSRLRQAVQPYPTHCPAFPDRLSSLARYTVQFSSTACLVLSDRLSSSPPSPNKPGSIGDALSDPRRWSPGPSAIVPRTFGDAARLDRLWTHPRIYGPAGISSAKVLPCRHSS